MGDRQGILVIRLTLATQRTLLMGVQHCLLLYRPTGPDECLDESSGALHCINTNKANISHGM